MWLVYILLLLSLLWLSIGYGTLIYYTPLIKNPFVKYAGTLLWVLIGAGSLIAVFYMMDRFFSPLMIVVVVALFMAINFLSSVLAFYIDDPSVSMRTNFSTKTDVIVSAIVGLAFVPIIIHQRKR